MSKSLQDQDLPAVISPDDEDNDDADVNEDNNEEETWSAEQVSTQSFSHDAWF